jgi:tetratricopeptide (TPR) repeat protein
VSRAFLVSLLLAMSPAASLADAAAGAAADATHPLLELARERQRRQYEGPRPTPLGASARAMRHALEQARVPTDEDCGASIGAPRFADLHAGVAATLTGDGDLPGATAAYRRALACRPRNGDLHAALGGVLFDLRDYAGARAAAEAALALDPRSVSSIRLAANLDFIEERWADAISRFRYVAASDPDRVRAGYGQLMYWLAQARAGIAHPESVTRTPGDGWPQPLLLYLRGQYTEAELVVPIAEGDDDDNNQPNTTTDERLAEALYYIGQAHWARGDSKAALDYFTALVNLRVTYFLEHGLAIAEIAKLRGN